MPSVFRQPQSLVPLPFPPPAAPSLTWVTTSTIFMEFKHANNKVEVAKYVKMSQDGTWVVSVFGHDVNNTHFPVPAILDNTTMVQNLLQQVDILAICIGNTDPAYIKIAKERKNLKDAYIHQNVILHNSMGNVHFETVRHSSCTVVLLDKTIKCKNYSDHEHSLRKMVSRAKQQLDLSRKTEPDTKRLNNSCNIAQIAAAKKNQLTAGF